MEEKRQHRWFRSFLRMFLVLVAAACFWLSWAANWKRQRRAFLETHAVLPIGREDYYSSLGLWVVGEPGIVQLEFLEASVSPESLDEARRLFPEAEIERP